MSKKLDNEVVVKFQSPIRKITMYFTEDQDHGLNMNMAMDPEFDPENKDEEPDLCMLLASTLMNALNASSDVEDDSNPKVYDGTD